MRHKQYTENKFGAELVHSIKSAIAAGKVSRTSGGLLTRLLAEAGIEELFSALTGGSGLTPSTIFDAFMSDDPFSLRQHISKFFEVIAQPGAFLQTQLLPGDILLRRALGEGNLAHLSMIETGVMLDDSDLKRDGGIAERGFGGKYVKVIEEPFLYAPNKEFHRLITDEAGRLPAYQMILRLKPLKSDRVGSIVEKKLPKVNLRESYGNYDLRRGDRDDRAIYGGQQRQGEAQSHVRQLQRDLVSLGFRLIGTPDGVFGRRTEWAVREFQIYAKMPHLAKENRPSEANRSSEAKRQSKKERYVNRLSQTPNTHPYRGPISGVVNSQTRAAMQEWLANDWRCPVIVEAWNMSRDGGSTPDADTPDADTPDAENIWLHDEVASGRLRMFVRDFSNYYYFPPSHNPDNLVVIGKYATHGSWSGPASLPPRHTWPEGEMLPEYLVGRNLAQLSPAQRSTYKVIRAVSEVECLGFFDCINAYDNTFVSLGPYHWTLGLVGRRSIEEGELCGYLSYLHYVDPATFAHVFENFGCRIDEDWVNSSGTPNGSNLFRRGSRKYAGWVALQQENGSYARMPLTERDGNYFKTWHWFYRFVMAGRTVKGFRRRMWDMARIRLRDILATPWGGGIPNVPDGAGGTRPPTIGDVYTSERAIALILRWHIRYPAHIVNRGSAGTRLRNAWRRAQISNTRDPSTWGDAEETALIDGIRAEAAATGNSRFIQSIQSVDHWPSWAASGSNPRNYTLNPAVGNLSVGRNSFQFDESWLPPPPY